MTVSFPAPEAGPVAVVGAGTAGCVVACRLLDAGYQVELFEAGTGEWPTDDARLASVDYLAAHQVDSRWWPNIRVVARAEPAVLGGGREGRYLAGRGVGGSSAVNGLIADVAGDDPALGPSAEVREARHRARMRVERVAFDELGDLDRAVLGWGGARLVDLALDGGRFDVAKAYLGGGGSGLTLRSETIVDRLDPTADRVTVRTGSGDRVDAAAVVLCAGAVHSPGVLLRSRLGFGVGVDAQDHPSVSLPVRLAARSHPSSIVTGAVVDRGDVQIVPLGHVGGHAGRSDDRAALLVALMRPEGAVGSVELVSENPAVSPVIRLRPFEVAADLRRLREGVRWVLEALLRDPFNDLVAGLPTDGHGRELTRLSDDELDEWIRVSPGVHSHLTSTCAIGRTLDDDGRVAGVTGVYVADASAFPQLPATGTHLPTILQAERLVARWLGT